MKKVLTFKKNLEIGMGNYVERMKRFDNTCGEEYADNVTDLLESFESNEGKELSDVKLKDLFVINKYCEEYLQTAYNLREECFDCEELYCDKCPIMAVRVKESKWIDEELDFAFFMHEAVKESLAIYLVEYFKELGINYTFEDIYQVGDSIWCICPVASSINFGQTTKGMAIDINGFLDDAFVFCLTEEQCNDNTMLEQNLSEFAERVNNCRLSKKEK